jgi:hypothetical protein
LTYEHIELQGSSLADDSVCDSNHYSHLLGEFGLEGFKLQNVSKDLRQKQPGAQPGA